MSDYAKELWAEDFSQAMGMRRAILGPEEPVDAFDLALSVGIIDGPNFSVTNVGDQILARANVRVDEGLAKQAIEAALTKLIQPPGQAYCSQYLFVETLATELQQRIDENTLQRLRQVEEEDSLPAAIGLHILAVAIKQAAKDRLLQVGQSPDTLNAPLVVRRLAPPAQNRLADSAWIQP